MKLIVVVQRGKNLNLTLSTIQFDRLGATTGQPVIICDTWEDGLFQACKKDYTHALFVASGTLFTDWSKWQTFLKSYPHQGLIGHLLCKDNIPAYLDEQCWLIDLNFFTVNDLTATTVTHPAAIRSDCNLHDNYTPLWIKPGTELTNYSVTKFGQGLIARQLQQGLPVVNWNNAARDLKFFIYKQTPKSQIDLHFYDYVKLAEHQLWIFNNEKITSVGVDKILAPGSGLFWIINIINPATTQIQIVDISYTQLKFVKTLWETWTGVDYGSFVWQFIQDNKLVNYEVDQANLTDLDRLKLRSQKNFIGYVNQQFAQVLSEHDIDNFVERWKSAQETKTIKIDRANLVDWVLAHKINSYDYIWSSNILNYKWTLMHTPEDTYQEFSRLIA